MSFMDLATSVEGCAKDSTNWQEVRKDILNRHAKASTVEEFITLLSLHKMLMDNVIQQIRAKNENDVIVEIGNHDYNQMLMRECIIGDSICVDTLYELTQRELDAGRLDSSDALMKLAVEAVAKPHYSREQLLRQESVLNNIKNKPSLNGLLSRLLRRSDE
jgi:hypothetical protein